MKKHSIKKLLAVVLTLAMTIALAVPAFAADPAATDAADKLNTLGLFKGVGTDDAGAPIYDLDRAPTRIEALIMLVRLLGKEEEALQITSADPFTDVPAYAAGYVGYAYANGLTNGISDTEFGSDLEAAPAHYLTFILRALGYTDKGETPDFTWDTSFALTDKLGITHGEFTSVNDTFLRGDVAAISVSALAASTTGGTTLLKKLVDEKAVTEAAVKEAGLDALLVTEAPATPEDKEETTTPPASSNNGGEGTPFVPTPKTYTINESYVSDGFLPIEGITFPLAPASELTVANEEVTVTKAALELSAPGGVARAYNNGEGDASKASFIRYGKIDGKMGEDFTKIVFTVSTGGKDEILVANTEKYTVIDGVTYFRFGINFAEKKDWNTEDTDSALTWGLLKNEDFSATYTLFKDGDVSVGVKSGGTRLNPEITLNLAEPTEVPESESGSGGPDSSGEEDLTTHSVQ